jgi:U2-associated protein SR140
MPDELVEPSPPPSPERVERQKRKHERRETRHESKKGMLSESQRDRLEDMLRNLTPQRTKVGDAMIYCIDHAESAEEIVDCIAESLSIMETPLYKKIARLYLISDILHNCSVKVANASFFRKGFQARLVDIFHDLHDCFNEIEGRLKAEQFKVSIELKTCFIIVITYDSCVCLYLAKSNELFQSVGRPGYIFT